MDWEGLEQAARVVAASGDRRTGIEVARLRKRVMSVMDEACTEVERVSGMSTEPRCELMIVDRRSWASGNIQTLRRLFEDVELSGTEARLVAWEGGGLVGLLSRAVLAQFDPFRDQLLVVHPNLGEMAYGEGLRYLMFHEVTHLAQFRTAPWIADHIVDLGSTVLPAGERSRESWTRDVAAQLPQRLPEIVRWVRQALEGKAQGSPLLDMLPEAQRESVMRLHALVTLLEGHATHVTDVVSEQLLPGYDDLKRRLEARRRRPPLMKLLEAIAGLEMKRQQYILGRSFCEQVWGRGGADALSAAWAGPDSVPTLTELREPERWLERVA